MGLDNALYIKGKTIKGKKFLAEHYNLLEKYGNKYEFFYSRKCWNIRNRFLEVFQDKDYDGQGGEFEIEVAELVDVVEHILKYFLNEKNWNYDGGGANGSIWEWHTMVVKIAESIRVIRLFLEDYEDYELSEDDFEITFIDSY